MRQTTIFAKWLSDLKDKQAGQRITRRIQRLANGNAGDSKSVGGAVSELRIDYGPGYRVYYTQRGATLVLLLCGGDKSTQSKDITQAKKIAAEIQD